MISRYGMRDRSSEYGDTDYQARHRREAIEISRTESAIIEVEWWGGRKLRLFAWNISLLVSLRSRRPMVSFVVEHIGTAYMG
jgi:hypothetical protein